ncbi:DnaJ homolog subfamily C member 14-like protein [Drosera capensis]
MARKANQPKNGLNHSSPNKKGVLKSGSGKTNDVEVVASEISCGDPTNGPLVGNIQRVTSGDGRKKNKKSRKSSKVGDEEVASTESFHQSIDNKSEAVEDTGSGMNGITSEGTNHRECLDHNSEGASSGSSRDDVVRNAHIYYLQLLQSANAFAFSVGKTLSAWVERHRPFIDDITNHTWSGRDYVRMRFLQIYPAVFGWLVHVGNIILTVLVLWLDSALRGMASILNMGTTLFLLILWCSILSLVMMIGFIKWFLVLALAALIGFFVSLIAAVLVFAAFGAVILWLYGSFWTTFLVVGLGGLAFALSNERLALLLATTYSVYSAWIYGGWRGILLALNFSFIFSDVLVYILQRKIDETRKTDSAQTAGMQDPPSSFDNESHEPFSENGSRPSADRSEGVASTSGADSEVSSEDELIRLLNCTDHYSALGFSRFQSIDAMLVHPDKNIGNEKAAEAFQKLQNAYEVLLDSLKRKAYDDELRREELLNYFRQFQSTPQQNRWHGLFGNGFSRPDGGSDEPPGELRGISCKKCGNFHSWFQTNKLKTQARWCEDCKDFHQAKDGDGWVEQSSQPFLLGLMQKVGAPSAYVCANGKVYDATQWYICQGMRCPANSHKPTFQVNTSMTKHYPGKGNIPHRGGIPSPNFEENLTEEDLFEFLRRAAQTGIFDNFDGTTSGEATNSTGAKAGVNGSSNSSKRKKKGKKPW